MTLDEYFKLNGMLRGEFAKKINRAEATVWRWEKGKRFPHRNDIRRITKATGGKVTANDFMVLPTKPARRARPKPRPETISPEAQG